MSYAWPILFAADEAVLLLEDDVIPFSLRTATEPSRNMDFKESLRETLRELPADWDMLYLGGKILGACAIFS